MVRAEAVPSLCAIWALPVNPDVPSIRRRGLIIRVRPFLRPLTQYLAGLATTVPAFASLAASAAAAATG